MMNRKVFVSALCILLAVLMALSLILVAVPARAVSESEIQELQKKRQQLEEQLLEQAELLVRLSEGHALIIDRKAALDGQIALNREDISLLERQIQIYDGIIWEKEMELEYARSLEETQYEQLRARMRAMEESGSYSYVTFLFESDSLTDLLSRLGDVSDIMQYDRDLEATLRETRKNMEEKMTEYETIRTEQDSIRAQLDSRQEQLNAQMDAACALIAQLELLGEDALAEFAAIEAAEAQAMEEELKALRQLANEQAAARQAALLAASYAYNGPVANAPTYSSGGAVGSGGVGVGGFIWPVDSTYVTSRFGPRTAPTAGASSNHPAIDISAPQGSPIYAAADGQVAVATYNGGLGNYVSIAHGDDTSTRYAHMTNFIVQPGEYVTQGQIIGYVGQTGIATGDHLDFAIISGGQAVDPLSYYDNGSLVFDPTA